MHVNFLEDSYDNVRVCDDFSPISLARPGLVLFHYGFSMKLLPAILLPALSAAAWAETITADVVVYGGSAGGVSAACTAARFGKTAVIAEFGKHIGGLTSGGLGQTDIGNKAAIGGFSRAFYQRLGKHYGKAEAWTFEPKVAEQELRALLSESKIPVKFQQRLASVKLDGKRISEITMEDGTVYRGKIFIDTTYEGDLMAKAGVKYMVGRESNSRFGETLNGIRAETPQHQFIVPVDPYVKPGDPSSGLLPFVQSEGLGTPGEGDGAIQAYNFRLCLTKKQENQLPIEPPAGYDAKKYELLGRYFQALAAAGKKVNLGDFMIISMVTAEKTDINNKGGFSTDFIGMNHSYADADYATREKIWNEHLQYIQGFITFLKSDERVPQDVRNSMAAWGLCKDEFQDTGGWPHNMYVREARRILSEYVMSESDCRGKTKPEDSVGLGAYNMDSHNCRRVVRDGKAHNEGDVQVGVKPYPISYRSIVPKQSECENLIVPICLGATHIAYGSIRMEPVFMILGQTASTAAVMAIDGKLPVQKVAYDKLREQLLKDGQVLAWDPNLPNQSGGNPGASESAAHPSSGQVVGGIVYDDSKAEKTGNWTSGNINPRVGNGYIHDGDQNKGSLLVKWNIEVPESGEYEIFLHFPPNDNRASNIPVTVSTGSESADLRISEKEKSGKVKLGKFALKKGTAGSVTISNVDTDGHVVVDGIQLLPAK